MTSSCLFSGYRATRENTTVTTIILCEGKFKDQEQAVIPTCPPSNILNLTYINYGRTQPYSEVCLYHDGDPLKDCGPTASVTEIVEALCQGQQTCRLRYTELDLRDTCYNT